MLFNSYFFLFVFLPVTAAGFALIGRLQPAFALGWLAFCSLFFYAYWNPAFLLLLGGSVVANYACGRAFAASKNDHAKNALLAAGIAANLGLIGYFKYAGFFLEIAHSILGTASPFARLALPLGISFFTFQQIVYLVDARKGLVCEHRFLHYVLFVTFFPHLIAGPITHHNKMIPQFATRRTFRFDADDVALGIIIFVLGLCKKVVLADTVSVYANDVFQAAASGGAPRFAEAWIGVLAFTFQLYFDFSGYSDMAVGLGRMFGFHFPVNFDSPYKATSIIEFWRRWHITLSQFLRDYLYIPLGGNRRGTFRRYANLMVTMLLGGLWHGAGWTFVVWGFLHGLYLCLNNAWRHVCARFGWQWTERAWWRVAAMATTFAAVVVGWVVFRADNIASAMTMFSAMLGRPLSAGPPLILSPGQAALTLLGLSAIVWLLPNTQQLAAHIEAKLLPHQSALPRIGRLGEWLAWRPSVASGVMLAILFVFTLTTMTKVREFIYFNF